MDPAHSLALTAAHEIVFAAIEALATVRTALRRGTVTHVNHKRERVHQPDSRRAKADPSRVQSETPPLHRTSLCVCTLLSVRGLAHAAHCSSTRRRKSASHSSWPFAPLPPGAALSAELRHAVQPAAAETCRRERVCVLTWYTHTWRALRGKCLGQ